MSKPDPQDDYWARLNEGLAASSQSYDRTLFSLAGGALVLSIAFLRDIAPEPRCLGLVVTAWIFLVLSLGATLFSHAASKKALLYSMKLHARGQTDHSRGGRWGTATDLLDWFAGAAFLAGAVLLVWFAILNLPKGA